MANGVLGYTSTSSLRLEDRFEIIKDVGDGSFGSVALAKVRSAGANIAKRGSVVRSDLKCKGQKQRANV